MISIILRFISKYISFLFKSGIIVPLITTRILNDFFHWYSKNYGFHDDLKSRIIDLILVIIFIISLIVPIFISRKNFRKYRLNKAIRKAEAEFEKLKRDSPEIREACLIHGETEIKLQYLSLNVPHKLLKKG